MREGESMPQPAKSAKLQLLNGNPNKKNTKELKQRSEAEERLKMKSDAINAPPWLDKTGKQAFEFIKSELLSIELVQNPDIYSMALFADSYSQYVDLKRQLKKMRTLHKKEYKRQKLAFEKDGTEVSIEPELFGNPLSKQMDTCAKNIRLFGTDIGLSPASRAKLAIKLAQDEGDDDWT